MTTQHHHNARALLLSQGRHPALGAVPTDLLTPEQVAEFLGMSPRTLAAWRYKRRGGPTWCKCGSLVRYRKADVIAWLDGGTRHGGEA